MNTPFEHHFSGYASLPPRRRKSALRAMVAGTLATAAVMFLVDPANAARPKAGFEPTLPPSVAVAPTAPPSAGSIFNASTGYTGFIEGRRAHLVGDLVTVVLLENFNSAKTAGAKTQKSGQFSITPPTAGPLSFLNPNALNASGGSSFNGQGNALQTSTLAGEVAVTIAEVRANGTALVRGEKRMMLSQGQEWVQFSGIVRLGDIDQENRILSTQIADARVEYAGNGSVGRASREGWLSKFFNAISPF